MGPRWTRRSVQVSLGRAVRGAAAASLPLDRSRHRGWRASKPQHFSVASSLKCSVGVQTVLLLFFSACMMLYIAVNPIEPEVWPESFAPHPPLSVIEYSGNRRWKHMPRASQSETVRVNRTDTQARSAAIASNATTAVNRGGKRITRQAQDPEGVSGIPEARMHPQRQIGPQPFTSAVSTSASRRRIKLLGNSRIQVFADPTGNYFPQPVACRMFRTCISKDGSYLLPGGDEQDAELLKYCGISNFHFKNAPRNSKRLDQSDMFANVLRYHMPHLATDLLSLSYAMSVVTGSYSMNRSLPNQLRQLRPIVRAQERIRVLKPGAWTSKMLSQLPFETEVFTPMEVFGKKRGAASSNVCFRSVVSFDTQIYWQVSPRRFDSENVLFKESKLWSRAPKNSLGSSADSRKKSACNPVVTVLNRPPHDQRTLVNIDDIFRNFEKLKTEPMYRNVATATLNVKYMNTSFEDQVRTIQNADLILASHGAALANLLFARIRTPVVEIFPFTYYANIFERMAHVMGLPHESVVAEPDDTGFFSCIIKQNTEKDAPSVRNETALHALQTKWQRASKAFAQQNDHMQFVTHHHTTDGDIAGIDGVRMCARNQVLRVNPRAIAMRLLNLVSSTCEDRNRP